jgi:hypothetical protein
MAVSDLDRKMAALDATAHEAVDVLISWLIHDRHALILMAKGRHVEGHYRFADTLMYEYSDRELTAQAAQELADAICYTALRVQRGAK